MLTCQAVGDAGREQSAGVGGSGSQGVLFGIGGSDSAVATSVECHAYLDAEFGEVHGRKEQDGEDDCYEDDADDDWLTHGMQARPGALRPLTDGTIRPSVPPPARVE